MRVKYMCATTVCWCVNKMPIRENVHNLRCVASVLQVCCKCAAVRCSVLQCVAVCCRLHCVLHCVAVCCSVLQYLAVYCSVLQGVAECFSVL